MHSVSRVSSTIRLHCNCHTLRHLHPRLRAAVGGRRVIEGVASHGTWDTRGEGEEGDWRRRTRGREGVHVREGSNRRKKKKRISS